MVLGDDPCVTLSGALLGNEQPCIRCCLSIAFATQHRSIHPATILDSHFCFDVVEQARFHISINCKKSVAATTPD